MLAVIFEVEMNPGDTCIVLRENLDCEIYLPMRDLAPGGIVPDHVCWTVAVSRILTSDDPEAHAIRNTIRAWRVRHVLGADSPPPKPPEAL